MEPEISDSVQRLLNKVIELSDQGKWAKALVASDNAVDEARDWHTGADIDSLALALALEEKGNLHRKINDLEEARLAYFEAIEIISDNPEVGETLARLNASTAVLYDLTQNTSEAITFYERALELYKAQDRPRMDEMVDICNNLGFIHRSLGDTDSAQKHFAKGVDIAMNYYGQAHPKTGVLYNNLGALYLNSGDLGQARDLLIRGLNSRKASLDEDHYDLAQSYSNLALAIAPCGDEQVAKQYFESAILIYEKHLSLKYRDYLTVVENYADLLVSLGEEKAAANMIKKSQKKVAKVKAKAK